MSILEDKPQDSRLIDLEIEERRQKQRHEEEKHQSFIDSAKPSVEILKSAMELLADKCAGFINVLLIDMLIIIVIINNYYPKIHKVCFFWPSTAPFLSFNIAGASKIASYSSKIANRHIHSLQ